MQKCTAKGTARKKLTLNIPTLIKKHIKIKSRKFPAQRDDEWSSLSKNVTIIIFNFVMEFNVGLYCYWKRSSGESGKNMIFVRCCRRMTPVLHTIYSPRNISRNDDKRATRHWQFCLFCQRCREISVRAIEAGRQQPRGDKKNSSRKRNIMHLRISRADIFVVYHSLKSFVVLFCARDFLLFSVA